MKRSFTREEAYTASMAAKAARECARTPEHKDNAVRIAKTTLAKEIAAAKREAATTPLYRRWPDDV